MITAIDTNVLVDLRSGDATSAERAVQALRRASVAGAAVICDIVYAEVCASFETRVDCDNFLETFEIGVSGLDRASSFLASQMWLKYLRSGGKRSRILPDFLVGAHAVSQADQLLTRDRGFYRTAFSKLKILEP